MSKKTQACDGAKPATVMSSVHSSDRFFYQTNTFFALILTYTRGVKTGHLSVTLGRYLRCGCLLADRLQGLSSGSEPCSRQPKGHTIELLRRADELFGTADAPVILPDGILEDADGLLLELEAIVEDLKEKKA